jgi:hypothetical protein
MAVAYNHKMFTALELSDLRVGVANTIAYCNELMAGPKGYCIWVAQLAMNLCALMLRL